MHVRDLIDAFQNGFDDYYQEVTADGVRLAEMENSAGLWGLRSSTNTRENKHPIIPNVTPRGAFGEVEITTLPSRGLDIPGTLLRQLLREKQLLAWHEELAYATVVWL